MQKYARTSEAGYSPPDPATTRLTAASQQGPGYSELAQACSELLPRVLFRVGLKPCLSANPPHRFLLESYLFTRHRAVADIPSSCYSLLSITSGSPIPTRRKKKIARVT